MRQIHLAEDLKLRFRHRGEEFNTGIEVGMVAALMAEGLAEVQRRVSHDALEQLTALAGKLGYFLVHEAPEEDGVRVTFSSRRPRPKLALVR